jgi:serine/threonine protein kinase/Flp pilus assembly protein TadD
MVGKTLSHYRIVEQLGAGGMGVVYRARDDRLGRDVALKLLPAEALGNASARRQLENEARTASALNHPHICTIHDVGEAEGQFFVAMEFVAGQPLAQMIPAGGLPEELVVRYGMQIADALAHAHERGIVHRDLKSANVVVTPEGRAKVLDFGLAQRLRKEELAEVTQSKASLTPGAGIAGTLAYMAPEVLRGELAEARSDIWALGVVLYEMAAGEAPFQGATGFELSSAILREPPRALPARVSSGIRSVVQRCLAKQPALRYQRASEVRAALETIDSRAGAAPAAMAGPSDSRRALLAGGVVLLVMAALLALNVGRVRDRLLGRGGPPRIESLAVLPLDNLSGDASQEYFADGMTEALISNLAQVGALRVISRTSVMQYKGTRKKVKEIAKELDNVDAVVEGSVQRSGERVKITVQLIAAATDTHLWAKDYEREVRDVLALQSEVARAIAGEIKVTLTPQEQARLATARSVSPEAYDFFLRGRAHNRHENREDNDAAIELLERAVALDPQLAAAHAELGRAYGIRLSYFTPEDKLLDEKSLEEVEKALRLDPDSAEAHLARGALLWTPLKHFPHEQAIREFRRAIELNPSLDEAHHQLGLVYLHIGLLEEAMREAQAAVKLNPGNTLALYRTGVVNLHLRNYARAWEIFVKIPVEFNPVLVTYQNAWTLFYLGRKAEAQATTEEYLKKYPQDEGGLSASLQAILAADAGQPRRAEEKIKNAFEHGKGYIHFHHTMYNVASAYALLNRPAEAVKWLQAAADEGLPCYPLFEKDPNLDKIRRDPGFVAFLAKQKQQWEAFHKL